MARSNELKESIMLLPHGTVIAVIDGRNFRLFRNTGDEAGAELVEIEAPRLDASNHSAGSHHGSAHHGRGCPCHCRSGMAERRGAGAPHRATGGGRPPRTIGEMRKHYARPLEKVLLGEVSGDLHDCKGIEILAQLKGK
jgi:protein required for attachment to host cells